MGGGDGQSPVPLTLLSLGSANPGPGRSFELQGQDFKKCVLWSLNYPFSGQFTLDGTPNNIGTTVFSWSLNCASQLTFTLDNPQNNIGTTAPKNAILWSLNSLCSTQFTLDGSPNNIGATGTRALHGKMSRHSPVGAVPRQPPILR